MTTLIDNEEFATTEETAAFLGLSRHTLNNWRSEGRGPPYLKLGPRIMYRRASVREWLISQERHPGRTPLSPPLLRRTK